MKGRFFYDSIVFENSKESCWEHSVLQLCLKFIGDIYFTASESKSFRGLNTFKLTSIDSIVNTDSLFNLQSI